LIKKIDHLLYYGLIALAFVMPISPVSANIVWPVLLLLWIAKMAALKEVRIASGPLALFVLVFILAGVLPAYFGQSENKGFFGVISIMSFLIFILVAENTADFKHAQKIGYLLGISYIMMLLLRRFLYPVGSNVFAGCFARLPVERSIMGLAFFILLLGAYFYYGFKKLRMVFGKERFFIVLCLFAVLGLFLSEFYLSEVAGCQHSGMEFLPIVWLLMALTFYKSRAVFLDRDGTINEDMHYSADTEKLKIFTNAGTAIKMLNEAGFKVVIVTNQSGVARGCFTEKDVHKLNDLVVERLNKENAFINGIYVCPHHPDIACRCRKPNTGMIKKAARDMNIDIKKSYVVGDMKTDMLLAKNTGAKGIFVLTGAEKTPPEFTDYAAKDIYAAAAWITCRKEPD